MTAQESDLFRREALEHRAAQRGPGDVVRVAPRWTTVAFYGLLGLMIAVLAAGFLIEIDRYAPGTTTEDASGRVVVLVPAAVAPEIAEGRPVELGDEKAEVVSSGEILDPSEVESAYGVEVLGPSIAVVTTARSSSTAGRARVLVEREPLVVSLIPGLKGLLGDG